MFAIQKCAAALLTVFLAAPLLAAEPPNWDELLRKRAEAFVDNSMFFGMAVGMIDGDKVHTACVGHRSIFGPPPDENTLFEIGSVTKTFTGILLADAVNRGEVTLDQPVAALLGTNAKVPQFKERPIRLIDLATQTSGLPRVPISLRLLENPLNPYASFGAEDLTQYLASYKLSRAPGDEFEYSNLGMGILGYALAKRAGMSYEALLKQRICEPLKMNDTVLTLSDDQNARMASGISLFGIPAANWDFDALAGCGAIRTSLHDMLIYLRANLSPETTPLGKAIAMSHEPRFVIRKSDDKSATKVQIGLAWIVVTEGEHTIVLHDGMTGGYCAFIAMIPDKRRGVVLLANKASLQALHFCNDLLKEMLGAKPESTSNLPTDADSKSAPAAQ